MYPAPVGTESHRIPMSGIGCLRFSASLMKRWVALLIPPLEKMCRRIFGGEREASRIERIGDRAGSMARCCVAYGETMDLKPDLSKRIDDVGERVWCKVVYLEMCFFA